MIPKDYEALMGVNPSSFQGDSLPVEQVTWFDAVLYCNALSKSQGKDTVYVYTGSPTKGTSGQVTTLSNLTINWSANGYRLPTEAE